MSDYKPISCDVYSRYELNIIYHQSLRVYWIDEAGMDHCEVLEPQDLQTKSGEEFLIARARHNRTVRMRLDRIARTEEM